MNDKHSKIRVKEILTYSIIIVLFPFIYFSCFDNRTKDEITVNVKIIEATSKKPRINDSIEVRIGKPSFPMRKYILVGKYCSDSLGETKIKILKNEIYSFSTLELDNKSGSTEFAEGELKNNQTVIIEVTSRAEKHASGSKNYW